jgi:hypothetical protein
MQSSTRSSTKSSASTEERFFGPLVTLDTDTRRHEVQLIAPMGFLRDDGLLVIACAGLRTDYASIPRPLWLIVGAPFAGDYRWSAVIHDAGYAGCVVIIDTTITDAAPLDLMEQWRTRPAAISPHLFRHAKGLPRKWWDDTFLQAMTAAKVNRVKRRIIYSGVRVGGWYPWRRHRNKTLARSVDRC